MTMYRVRNVFSGLQGAPYLATHYLDAAGGTAQQAVDAVGTFWTAIDANLDSELTWRTEGVVDSINEANGDLVSSTATTSATGTGGTVGPVLPFASQGLIRWTTAGIVAGRRVKGRTFVPGVTELGVDNGVMLASVISQFNVQAAAYIGDLTSVPVVWARPFAGNPLADPPQPARAGTMHPITGADTWNQLAVLRSRRD
jgi:hypothetical protein